MNRRQKIQTFFTSEKRFLEKQGYVSVADLNEGTYSKVRQAKWKQEDGKEKVVALKIINRKVASECFLERFLPRELEILRVMKHKNIVQLFDVLYYFNKIYIVLELGEGGDLLDYIRLRGVVVLPKRLQFFREICAGLEYMHQLGIAHRDLKCENILLNRYETVKIADLGFARYVNIEASELLTTFCGSVAYASPELLKSVPYRADLADFWSLGVALYVMSCACMPFREDNVAMLLADQKEDGVYIPENLMPFDEDLYDLLSNILEYEVDKRFTMEDIKSSPWFEQEVQTQSGTLEKIEQRKHDVSTDS